MALGRLRGMSAQVYLLEEVEGFSKDLLGGKGFGLVAMRKAGLPVPPAFVITTEACRRYLEDGGGTGALGGGAGQDGGPRGPNKKSFRSLPSSKSTRLAKRLSERPRLQLPLLRGRKREDFI
jgi:phosphoenolpyruvate synthase/pyruvate phosphate dikinase